MTADWSNELPESFETLGSPSAEFVIRRSRTVSKLIIAPLAFLAGLVLLLVGLFTLDDFRVRNRAKALILGPALMVGGAFLGVRAFVSRGLSVRVYPEGLLRLQAGRIRAVLWDEVDSVRYGRNEGHLAGILYARESYTLSGPEIEPLHLDDNLPQLGELGRLIRQHTLDQLLARAVAAYQAGDVLDFDKVQVSREGVREGRSLLPWHEISGVESEEERVVISRQGRRSAWSSIYPWEAPNFHVLREVLTRTVREEARRDDA